MRRLLACLLFAFPAVSNAWWNDDWNFRKEITLDLSPAGANIAGSPLDVPVLVKLHVGNFQYFADTKPDGSDLRFMTADDKLPLKFHIERYDPTNQLAYLWVRVPRLAGGANTDKVFLYYGNPKATAGADAAGTFDASQSLVLHFAEDSAPPQDATAYKNSAAASTAVSNPASLIAGGLKFNGSATVNVPSTPSLRIVPADGATLSAWVRVDAAQADAYVLDFEDAAGSVALGINGLVPFVRAGAPASPVTAVATSPLAAGEWHHLAVTIKGDRLALVVDGAEVATAAATVAPIAGTLYIGGAAGPANRLTGEVDEVQVSKVARSPEWLQAAARGQGQLAPLVSYGADAQREGAGGKTSYLAITMSNVTIDGWVVIGVLGVMFVIAMIIIVGKAIYLARVQSANRKFLQDFEQLGENLSGLDPEAFSGARTAPIAAAAPVAPGAAAAVDLAAAQARVASAVARAAPAVARAAPAAAKEAAVRVAEDVTEEDRPRYTMSTVYPLYHRGISELTDRLHAQVASGKSGKTLTPQSIQAIRATMDASQVRLTQRLSAQMVLLTIAISGGPFLGLLGTVVGVMITFAAIAASGDVNVNSIAPGIAAALAATVAGLAVAIPALFGYNWLNTQIKNVNAEMRVFVDEFVTRIAEKYS